MQALQTGGLQLSRHCAPPPLHPDRRIFIPREASPLAIPVQVRRGRVDLAVITKRERAVNTGGVRSIVVGLAATRALGNG